MDGGRAHCQNGVAATRHNQHTSIEVQAEHPQLAFTLILRLGDGFRPSGWSKWVVVGQQTEATASTQEPFKRYPVTGHHYFAAHVGRVLFPAGEDGEGQRWVQRPQGMQVCVEAGRGAWHTMTVELLEIVSFELEPRPVYGLVHMSYAGNPSKEDMLDCAQALHRRYPATRDGSGAMLHLRTSEKGQARPLRDDEPLAMLAEQLFGSRHWAVSRRAWICSAARKPDGLDNCSYEAWRRGLARGFSLEQGHRAVDNAPERHKRQSTRLGPFEALVPGRGAAFTQDGYADPGVVYNVRSYWAETLLLAIAQHDYLEGFAGELSELGQDPLSLRVDEIYSSWLAFRNVLGWSYLSNTTDVPQRLLLLARNGLLTAPLREELEHAFQIYTAQRRRRSDDAQEARLAALQVYGAVFAAVGTVAAALQVIGAGLFDRWAARAVVLVGLAALGVVVYIAMRRRVS